LKTTILILAMAFSAHSELIDRIAVSVGSKVITQSELERQIRVIAFQNGVKPDFSSANKHAVAEKMIEQKLIQRDLEYSRYPQPTAADLAPALADFKKHFGSEEAYQQALKDAGLREEDLLDLLVWERTVLEFIELRFESGVLLNDQDVAEYARQNKVTPAEAEKALTASRADQQLDQWLREARRRTTVITHEEAFR
jgi:hypothetical protein